MKKVSLTDIKKARSWILPAGVVALGAVAFVSAQGGRDSSKAAVTDVTVSEPAVQATDAPAPTATPNITVNGTKIPTDKEGVSEVNTSEGKARVEVSGGRTRITTSEDETSGDTSSKQSGNVDIHLYSQTNGGTSSGTTQIHGYSRSSNNSGSNFNSTTVISSDSTTNVSQ